MNQKPVVIFTIGNTIDNSIISMLIIVIVNANNIALTQLIRLILVFLRFGINKYYLFILHVLVPLPDCGGRLPGRRVS